MPSYARYRSLDMWRGVACLFVVVYHSTLYTCEMSAADKTTAGAASLLIGVTNQLHVGVAMFFVISGYCISATADSTRRRGRRVSEYFYRRVRRIFPPYWIALAAFVLLVVLIEGWLWPGLMSSEKLPVTRPWSLSAWQWAGNVSLTESWRSNVVGGPRYYLLGPSWTLCYEEQFYAVMGLLLLVARQRLFLGALVVTLLTILVKLAARPLGLPIDGFFFDGHWILFAAGILAYYRINYASRALARPIDAVVIGTAVALLAVRPSILGGENAYLFALTASLFTLLIISAHRWDLRVSASRWLRPISYCGTMCYSLYLVHSPIIRCVSHALHRWGITSDLATLAVTVPLCTAASVLAAAVFHRYVERRFLNQDLSVKDEVRRPPDARERENREKPNEEIQSEASRLG